jgi:hypothetical protein
MEIIFASKKVMISSAVVDGQWTIPSRFGWKEGINGSWTMRHHRTFGALVPTQPYSYIFIVG